jgi:hypothetical protein
MKESTLLLGGDNSKRVKIHWFSFFSFLQIAFSRPSLPNSSKCGTNYIHVKGIQVCSNKGPVPLQFGDNHKEIGDIKKFSSPKLPS